MRLRLTGIRSKPRREAYVAPNPRRAHHPGASWPRRAWETVDSSTLLHSSNSNVAAVDGGNYNKSLIGYNNNIKKNHNRHLNNHNRRHDDSNEQKHPQKNVEKRYNNHDDVDFVAETQPPPPPPPSRKAGHWNEDEEETLMKAWIGISTDAKT
ncbi:hypothetical protein LXL04_000734 [Taraxacum kok-saghyz]